MSGGYRNSSVDSPGKHNTRSKYAFVVQSTAPVVPVAFHEAVHVAHHFPMSGGYKNAALESPGKYSSRVKYTSIVSHPVHSVVTVAHHATALHPNPIQGGFQNRPVDSPGKQSSRVKYASIRSSSVPAASSVAPIVAYAHPIKGGYYNAPLESPGKYSSRVKYTSVIRGIAPFASRSSVSSSAAAPSAGRAAVSQAQIDAVQKQYAGAYTCILQVVKARTSDPEQNYFQDEFDGEGLNIDEAAVRKMLQSLPAPLNLQSVENKGKFELKFVVQNTATKLSSDFIITYKGGDIDICSAD